MGTVQGKCKTFLKLNEKNWKAVKIQREIGYMNTRENKKSSKKN